MSNQLQDWPPYGPDARDWPHPDTLKDLASVYLQLHYIDILDQNLRKLAYGLVDDVSENSREEQWIKPWETFEKRFWADQRREFLWARAAHLSRGGTRALKLTDLSTEVLLMIFKEFQYSEPLDDNTGQGTLLPFPIDHQQTVQSLRLVSHRFHDLATPFLLPILNLSVSQKSLERIQLISANPLLASGVRAFRTGIEYRPTAPQRSFVDYLNYHKTTLAPFRAVLETELEDVLVRRAEEPVDPATGRGVKVQMVENHLLECNQRSTLVRAATRRCLAALDATPDEDEDSSDEMERPPDDYCVAEYMKLLTMWYREYAQTSKEQSELISNGSFISTVALLASQLRRPLALELFQIEPTMPPHDVWKSNTPFRSISILHSYLTAPASWSQVRHALHDEPNLAVRIIYDLIPAIHEAGGQLDTLNLNCPPLAHHFGTVQRTDPLSSLWDRLSAAAQNLRVLYLPQMQYAYQTSIHSSHENLESFEKYFAALLSGRNLEKVYITGFSSDCMCALGGHVSPSVPVGNMLENIDWPKIKRLVLTMVSISPAQAESFSEGLPDDMEELILDRFFLTGRNWERAASILREKAAEIPPPTGDCSRSYASIVALGDGEVTLLSDIADPIPPQLQGLEDHPELFLANFIIDYPGPMWGV